jgi:hypothetical protein
MSEVRDDRAHAALTVRPAWGVVLHRVTRGRPQCLTWSLSQQAKEPSACHLLSFCEVEGEVSLLLDEEDVDTFPANAVTVCPVRWTAIKLCGRRFDFSETGIVSAMSKVRPEGGSLTELLH